MHLLVGERDSTALQCSRTKTGDGPRRWGGELSCVSLKATEAAAEAAETLQPQRVCDPPEEVDVARQVFIQLERDTMW